MRHSSAEPGKPTALMAKICQHIELFPGATKNKLRDLGNHEWVDKAIAHLVADGFVKVIKDGKRLRFEILKEYSEDT